MTGQDLQAFRESLGLSQSQFAQRYRLVPHTLALWEQGKRQPTGPALILLDLIALDPPLIAKLIAKLHPGNR